MNHKLLICVVGILAATVFADFSVHGAEPKNTATATTKKSVETTTKGVGGATFVVKHLSDWKFNVVAQADPDADPRIEFLSPALVPSVLITFHDQWEGGTKQEYLEALESGLSNLFERQKGKIEDTKAKIEKFEGDHLFGYSMTLTYKPVQEKVKAKDDFRKMTVFRLLVDGYFVFASVAFNNGDDPSYQEALKIIRSLKLQKAR